MVIYRKIDKADYKTGLGAERIKSVPSNKDSFQMASIINDTCCYCKCVCYFTGNIIILCLINIIFDNLNYASSIFGHFLGKRGLQAGVANEFWQTFLKLCRRAQKFIQKCPLMICPYLTCITYLKNFIFTFFHISVP